MSTNGMSRRYEAVLERHLRMVALYRDGVPPTTIARMVGYQDHSGALYHLRGRCKCLPRDGQARTPAEEALAVLKRELRAIEDRLIAEHSFGNKPDYHLAQALRRALLLVGLEPRMAQP